jgi:hypothetical protein
MLFICVKTTGADRTVWIWPYDDVHVLRLLCCCLTLLFLQCLPFVCLTRFPCLSVSLGIYHPWWVYIFFFLLNWCSSVCMPHTYPLCNQIKGVPSTGTWWVHLLPSWKSVCAWTISCLSTTHNYRRRHVRLFLPLLSAVTLIPLQGKNVLELFNPTLNWYSSKSKRH